MRTVHFDPFSGISGDMALAALADLGVAMGPIQERLAHMLPFPVELKPTSVVRRGLAGTLLEVAAREDHPPHRGLSELIGVLEGGDLPQPVRERSERSFRLLAEAEARVHGTDPEQVHFHEIGAGDTLVDVIGTHLALHELGVERVTSGPVAVGSGTVTCAHGVLPVPAPATAELLKGIPLRDTPATEELTTPTGAALLRTVCASYAVTPLLEIERIGYGFGTRDAGPLPNALRVFLGEAEGAPGEEEITVLETTVDDMSGEQVGYLIDTLLGAGALDVTATPVGMKKSRPGMRLTVLARPGDGSRLGEALLRETTTFGVRLRRERRIVLEREVVDVKTPWGTAKVKIGRLRGRVLQISPEYEDCRRLASAARVPLREVQQAAVAAYRAMRPEEP